MTYRFNIIIDVEDRSIKEIVKELVVLLDLKKEKKVNAVRTDI